MKRFKDFLVRDKVQGAVNILLAIVIWVSLSIGIITHEIVWLSISGLVSVIAFLVYNTWVSGYINRDRCA
jgi:hypothetical protein